MKKQDSSKAKTTPPLSIPYPFGKKVSLLKIDPRDTGHIAHEDEVEQQLRDNLKRLYDLHYLMYAENKRSLLIILQGIDASGKDGAVRHLASGMNPLGVKAYSFKQPSDLELDHDYLWRIHQAAPGRGEIAIFNRSHYEEVSVVKVHPTLLTQQRLPDEIARSKKLFRQRYRQINHFEQMLAENGTVILKFFLHISNDEQEQRLNERLRDARKHWKFQKSDLLERQHWNDYMKAFEKMIEETNTRHAPWHIIPADKKWYRNYLVGKIVVETMQGLKMTFPGIQ